MSIFEPLPDGPFDIIYADPPWSYQGATYLRKQRTHKVSNHYDTLSPEQLSELPVQDIAADDSLLFLWMTGANLDKCMEVGLSWGFKWATMAFVWNKVKPVVGHYTMSQCEFVGVFKKGRIPKPRNARNIRQYLEQPRGEHSSKPYIIQRRIMAMFLDQSKIELFARKPYPGWTAWGNEVQE